MKTAQHPSAIDFLWILTGRGADKRGLFKTSHGERHENLSPRAYWFEPIWATQALRVVVFGHPARELDAARGGALDEQGGKAALPLGGDLLAVEVGGGARVLGREHHAAAKAVTERRVGVVVRQQRAPSERAERHPRAQDRARR